MSKWKIEKNPKSDAKYERYIIGKITGTYDSLKEVMELLEGFVLVTKDGKMLVFEDDCLDMENEDHALAIVSMS